MAFQMIGSMFKMGVGLGQYFQGQAGLSSLQRPEYDTPRQIQEMLALSRMEYADPTMPGEMAARDIIAQQSALGLQQSSAAGNPFGAIAAIQAGQQAADLNLTTQAAQYNRQDLEAYKQALQVAGQHADMEFQLNEFAPYAEQAQEYRDMIGAGTKNLFGGISEMGSLADALAYSQSDSGANEVKIDYGALSDAYSRYKQGGGPNDMGMGGDNSQKQGTGQDMSGYFSTNKSSLYTPTQKKSAPSSGQTDFSRLLNMGFRKY